MSKIEERWYADAQVRAVLGHRIVYKDSAPDAKASAPALVILHGFPTSSLDFHPVWPRLTASMRTVVHDHPGFGHSEKPLGYSYSLFEQAETALVLWRDLGLERVHLLAHDYGTSVATEILARRERIGIPIDLISVTLCNASMHIELAKLRWLQILLRSRTFGPTIAKLTRQATFNWQMRRIWGDAARVDPEDLDAMWAGMVRDEGRTVLPMISQYLHERRRFWHRWIGSLTRLDVSAHVLWGLRDPIAVPAIAQQLAREIPDVRYTQLPELGHYPMLEDPEAWSEAAAGFLEETGT